MSSFTEPLIVRVTQKEKRPFQLEWPFTYEVGHKGSGLSLTVPAGFETDFASVPFGFRWLVPVVGRHGKAAVLHDALYAGACVGWAPPMRDRALADAVFFEAMTVLEVRPWRKWLIWLAVRVFGGRYWHKQRILRERNHENRQKKAP